MLSATNPAPATPRVVLDTNVVLDLWLFADPRVDALRRALERRSVEWHGCRSMRDELERVLDGPLAVRREVKPETVLRAWDTHVLQPLSPDPPPIARLICSDPDDQVFVELALANNAEWLLTSDRALLRLARRARPHGLTICPAARWCPGSTR